MGLLVAGVVSAQSADETAAACTDAARLIGENDIDGALEEARWCVEGLQQMKQQLTLKVFPDEVEGYIGGEVENQSAMGMSMIERLYTRDGRSIEVELSQLGKLGGAGAGALAALAQMGLNLGGSGGKKMRIQKRTVMDMSDSDGEAQFMIQLKSGGMLRISSENESRDKVLAFVKAFPIAAIDDTLSP